MGKKSKLWGKIDKSPIFDKNKKKKENAKKKLRARSLSIEIQELKSALTAADGDSNLPSDQPNASNVFDDVDSEIKPIDMMKILTPRRKQSMEKEVVQDELDLSLTL